MQLRKELSCSDGIVEGESEQLDSPSDEEDDKNPESVGVPVGKSPIKKPFGKIKSSSTDELLLLLVKQLIPIEEINGDLGKFIGSF